MQNLAILARIYAHHTCVVTLSRIAFGCRNVRNTVGSCLILHPHMNTGPGNGITWLVRWRWMWFCPPKMWVILIDPLLSLSKFDFLSFLLKIPLIWFNVINEESFLFEISFYLQIASFHREVIHVCCLSLFNAYNGIAVLELFLAFDMISTAAFFWSTY